MRDLIAQDSHERATLVFRHQGKARDLAGLLLVIEQGGAMGVQRTQRGQLRRLDPQHRSQVSQQHRRHGSNAVERSAAHAHEGVVVLFAPIDTPDFKKLNEIRKLREAARGTLT